LPLCITTITFVSLDLIRIHIPVLNRIAQDAFGFILRKHEFNTVSAASWFLFAAIISIILFSKTAAMLGFLYLAVGDPTASYCGIRWGKGEIGKKTWVGTAGFFIICWIVGVLWMWQFTLFRIAAVIAGISSLGAALAERYIKEIDDNFTVPLISSSLIALLMIILL